MKSRIKTSWFKQLVRWNSKPIHKMLEMNQSKRLVHVFKLEPKDI